MKVFTADVHNFHKAMARAEVGFPASKADIISKLGEIEIQVDFDKFAKATSFVETMIPESYVNASAFYNAFMAAYMVKMKKSIQY